MLMENVCKIDGNSSLLAEKARSTMCSFVNAKGMHYRLDDFETNEFSQ